MYTLQLDHHLHALGLNVQPMEGSPSTNLCDSKIKRSLVISPNLDALLEHEERTRALSEMTTSPRSSRSVSPSDEYPVGLPPPPRHPRRVKSPHSLKGNSLGSEDKEPQARQITPTTSCSISNPYINPAPTLADLLVHTSSKVSHTPNPSPNSPNPHDYEHILQSSYWSESRGGSPIITTSQNFAADNSGQRPCINRNVDASIRNPDDRQQPSRTTKPLSPASLQAHDKGKAESIKDCTSAGHKNNSPTYSAPVYLAQTQGASGNPSASAASAAIDPDSTKPWRQRPLISHAGLPSGLLESSNTFSLPSTPSENKHRISISSTIYPASSTHSHSYSFYNDSVPSLAGGKRNRETEIYSLSGTEFNLDRPLMDCPQLSPIQFSPIPLPEYSQYSPPSSPRSLKPPIPTTPKPVFSRTSARPRVSRQVVIERPKSSGASLPPTTNFLDAEERADLVRKTRKLARVFGQTPRADAIPHQDKPTKETPLSPSSRYSFALNDLDWPILRRRRSALQLEPYSLNGGRRHSMPLSPRDMPFMNNLSPGHLSPSSNQAGHHAQAQIRSKSSPTSFIDLSDSPDGDEFTAIMPEADKMTRLFPTPPAQSQVENMFEEEHPDEDRKRKRERLAKLHRFLGSRVPVNLVLGIDNVEASLPPPHPSPTDNSNGSADPQKPWSKRRRSSSALPISPHWPNDLERVKEELNDQEKSINVRRAVKMEKVFGVAPPQTLYHTRHCSSPLVVTKSEPSRLGTTSPPTASLPLQTNQNRSAYMKHRKNDRPGTSESNILLLPKDQQNIDDLVNIWGTQHSAIYNHYQNSLNSLHDILDRDDKESLVELHQYLNEDSSTQMEVISPVTRRRISNASSIKSGRRRSLPTLTSVVGFSDSEYSITRPEIDVTPFELRRRRAAKLTQFFGVDYRELISDILQSIESGLDHERMNGTLHAEEFEDLRARLRNLKSKRQSFL